MEKLEEGMMKVFSIMGRAIGFKGPVIKMLAVLYLEPKEIAMEEIAERTGYSLATVSNTMKMLETVGIVQRSRKPGTKKVFFFMEKNLVKLNIQKIQSAQKAYVSPAKQILPGLIREYKSKVKTKEGKDKVKIMEDYYRQMLSFEKILEKWQKDLENIQKEKWY